MLSVYFLGVIGGTEATVEVKKSSITVYLAGTAAIFIIIFWVFLKAYRMIMSLLTTVLIFTLTLVVRHSFDSIRESEMYDGKHNDSREESATIKKQDSTIQQLRDSLRELKEPAINYGL